MSSGSVIGRCRITVPAAEKITTRMIRMTPVLMELSVCQVERTTERSDRLIFLQFLASTSARSAPTCEGSYISIAINRLQDLAIFFERSRLSHNTHLHFSPFAISPTRKSVISITKLLPARALFHQQHCGRKPSFMRGSPLW